MGTHLPELSEQAFSAGIGACSPRNLGKTTTAALFLHYQELRRWNPTLSLVGPGTANEVITRHYGEALEGLRLLPEAAFDPDPFADRAPLNLVDVGSGGGFPGFVLAAACPGLQVILVEARQKKWSFLRSASRKAGVSCSAVNSRVEVPLPGTLPDTIHLLTLRALGLPEPVFEALRARFPRSGRLLLWQTLPLLDSPPGFRRLRTISLPGADRRCIGEYGPENTG